jgi:F420-dependent oxidoreductase-like protein
MASKAAGAPRFGIVLPQIAATWQAARDAALDAERLGFDSVWLIDHLLGFPSPQVPIFEAWTELSALAAATRRIRLGVHVLCNSFRNPALLAKMAATLDQISGGRLDFGIGAGWYQAEYDAYGYEFATPGERLRRLDEALGLVRRLWTEESVTHEGAYYRMRDAWCRPAPLQRPHPPILVGAGGEKLALRVVARHAQTWNVMAPHASEIARKREVLRRHCAEIGRDPDEIAISLQTAAIVCDSEAEAERRRKEAGPALALFGDLRVNALFGTPEQACERVQRYRALGVSHFITWVPERWRAETTAMLAEKVAPEHRV